VGVDVIFVCPTASDRDFLELQRVGYALAKYGLLSSFQQRMPRDSDGAPVFVYVSYGTRRRIFCVPFMGYSTMERAVHPGEIVSAKTNICMMSSIPSSGMGNCFLLLDLHVEGLLHYFEGPCIRVELYAEQVLLEGIRALDLTNFMFASADLGRPKWVCFVQHA
jgi:hypothetical protein